jgi:hypothetical protein
MLKSFQDFFKRHSPGYLPLPCSSIPNCICHRRLASPGMGVFPRSADCLNPQRVDRQVEIKPSRPGWRSAAS